MNKSWQKPLSCLITEMKIGPYLLGCRTNFFLRMFLPYTYSNCSGNEVETDFFCSITK